MRAIFAFLFFIFCLTGMVTRSAAEVCNSRMVQALKVSLELGESASHEVAKKILTDLENNTSDYLSCTRKIAQLAFQTNSADAAALADLLFTKSRQLTRTQISEGGASEIECGVADILEIGTQLGNSSEVARLYRFYASKMKGSNDSNVRCSARINKQAVSSLLVNDSYREAAAIFKNVITDQKYKKEEVSAIAVAYGQGLLAKGRYSEAFGAFEDAIQRGGDCSELAVANYWLALRAKEQGYPKQFKSYLNQAMTMLDKPKSESARDLYTKLLLLSANKSFPNSKDKLMRSAEERLLADSRIAAWK